MSLTTNDKKWVKKTIDDSVAQNNSNIFGYMNQTFAKQPDIEDVKKELKKIDKVIDMLDTILGNQMKDKQDLDLVSARVGDHEDRIQKLESKS